MATKIQQIIEDNPNVSLLFGEWLSKQKLDAKSQYAYMKRGWLDRISKGVYVLKGKTPTLFNAIAAYNNQLDKHCVIGAYTALELRGYSHYLSLGKPTAFLFTDRFNKIPTWLINREWDMTVRYMTTSFLGEDLKGVEQVPVDGEILLVSSPERAFLECLNLPEASSSLLDIYYIMESLTTLRPKLLQQLLESCSSQKVKRLFLYMAEKAGHQWFNALKVDSIVISKSRLMAVTTGKYISKYNMTVPKELAEYKKQQYQHTSICTKSRVTFAPDAYHHGRRRVCRTRWHRYQSLYKGFAPLFCGYRLNLHPFSRQTLQY